MPTSRFDINKETVAAAGYAEPITSTRAWAVSWIAAARALDHGGDWRFRKAAFATALHDTLLAQVPSRQSQLDAALGSSLDAIPDGRQKSHGIAAGSEEAEQVLADTDHSLLWDARAVAAFHVVLVDTQIVDETIDGRVWEGVHFRFSDEVAAKVGEQVAAWDLPRLGELGL
jgi:hypothetical protein